MKEYSLNSWQDYWKIYDDLITLLKAENKHQIALEFEEAQKYVNGLTDGWYEFKFAFERTLQANRNNMTTDQISIADFLIEALNKSLAKR